MIKQLAGTNLFIKLIIILVLLLIVIGVNLIYSSVANTIYIFTGDEGDVIYVSGFDGFLDEWQTSEGRLSAQIVNETMQLDVGTVDTIYSATNPIFNDFDMRVEAQAVDGPIDNGYGVIFRLQEPTTQCDMPLQILCDLAEIDVLGVVLRLIFRPENQRATGYYMFLISSDGFYSVWQAEDRNGATIAQEISTWIAHPAINQGLDAQNEIRVIGSDNTFKFFINDEQVELCIPDDPEARSTFVAGTCLDGQMLPTFIDDAFTQGKIGVVARATETGGSGVSIQFDNMLITQPTRPNIPQT